jgi:ketosteroid isomerase-like protein
LPGDSDPIAAVERFRDAINSHDLDALVDCFADDYDSEQPAHPGRAFRGNAQVRENWSEMFSGVPDLKAELLGSAIEGDTVWSEWSWHGTRADGAALAMTGVTVIGVTDGRFAWARLYMEPVEAASADVGMAIRRDLLEREQE